MHRYSASLDQRVLSNAACEIRGFWALKATSCKGLFPWRRQDPLHVGSKKNGRGPAMESCFHELFGLTLYMSWNINNIFAGKGDEPNTTAIFNREFVVSSHNNVANDHNVCPNYSSQIWTSNIYHIHNTGLISSKSKTLSQKS